MLKYAFYPDEEIVQVIAKKKITMDFLFKNDKDPIGGILIEIRYDEFEENNRTTKKVTDFLVDGIHVCDKDELLRALKQKITDFSPDDKDSGKNVISVENNIRDYAAANNIDLKKYTA